MGIFILIDLNPVWTLSAEISWIFFFIWLSLHHWCSALNSVTLSSSLIHHHISVKMELRELFPSNFYNLHQFCHLKVAWDVLIVYGKFFFTLDFPLKLFLFLYFILCTSKTSTTYLSIPSTYLLILVQILKSFLKGFHDPCFWTFDWNENEMLLHFEEEREKKICN